MGLGTSWGHRCVGDRTWGLCGAVVGLGMGTWGRRGVGAIPEMWGYHRDGQIAGPWGHLGDVMGTSWSHHGVWGHPRAMGTRWGWGDRGDVLGASWGRGGDGDVPGMWGHFGVGDMETRWRYHRAGDVGVSWGDVGCGVGWTPCGGSMGTSEGGGGQPGGVGDHWEMGMCPPPPGLGSPMEPCCPHGFGVTTMAAIPGGGTQPHRCGMGGAEPHPPPHTINAVTVVTPDPPPNDIR